MLRLDRTKKSFRLVALSSLGLACPFDMLRQTSENLYFLNESCNFGKLRSVVVHSCEFGHVFGGQAAGFSEVPKQCATVKVSEKLLLLVHEILLEEDPTLHLAFNALGFSELKLRLRGLDLELLPLNFVAVLFRRVRTTAESLPQEIYLHRTGQEDQHS